MPTEEGAVVFICLIVDGEVLLCVVVLVTVVSSSLARPGFLEIKEEAPNLSLNRVLVGLVTFIELSLEVCVAPRFVVELELSLGVRLAARFLVELESRVLGWPGRARPITENGESQRRA